MTNGGSKGHDEKKGGPVGKPKDGPKKPQASESN
jgi:hypothetical protein